MIARIVIGFLFSAQAFASTMTVVVDPGHGGRDDGAVRDGRDEAAITLSVGRYLAEYLRADKRFKVPLTRPGNETLTLPERARFAKIKNADIFVSIHVNSNPDGKARGAEFYFQNQLPPDEESMFLAHRENSEGAAGTLSYGYLEERRLPSDIATIVTDLLDGDRILRSSQLSKALKTSWTGSKKSKTNSVLQAPFFVLSQMPLPSSLVELGFLTNADDLRELVDPGAQKRMARDLYRGLVAYKESMDKHTATP